MIDSRLIELLPHRPPMLLPTKFVSVDQQSASSEVHISPASSFYMAGKGVPASIGIEYMGQTAALIAGYQKQHDLVEPHLGFLIGVRHYQSVIPSFVDGAILRVSCQEVAVVGNTLATFDCLIVDTKTDEVIAKGNLSVMRKPLDEPTND